MLKKLKPKSLIKSNYGRKGTQRGRYLAMFSLKEYGTGVIGILLTSFGFIYQVIGAWPFWDKAYPWSWQIEIAKYGDPVVWSFFFLSFISLIIGSALLYLQSNKNPTRLK
jgi:hypothetical protein